jgi:hypothetical protein
MSILRHSPLNGGGIFQAVQAIAFSVPVIKDVLFGR